MKIIALSDTHNVHEYVKLLPEADVLVHSGDATIRGSIDEIKRFASWLSGLNQYKKKIFVSGNHDFGFDNVNRDRCENIMENAGIIYLRDNGVEIDGVRFWGAPWQPQYHNWAFNLPRNGKEIEEKWNLIPTNTNVLITHGPSFGTLDETDKNVLYPGEHVGCTMLALRIEELQKYKNIKAHIHGHIHPGYGMIEKNNMKFVNASICDHAYNPINRPILIEI